MTFVKTFQKATASSTLKVERPKQRPISGSVKLDPNRKKKAASVPPQSEKRPKADNNNVALAPKGGGAGYMKPTKTAILRQTTDATPSPSSITSSSARPSKKASSSDSV
jgi:hypothetical protein